LDWFYEGYQYAVTDGVKAVAGHRPQPRMPDQPGRRRVARGRTRHPVSETLRKVRMTGRGLLNARTVIRLRL